MTEEKLTIKEVECELSDNELIARLQSLATVDREIKTIESEKATSMSEFNKALKDKRHEQSKLLAACECKREMREIECRVEVVEALKQVRVVRCDTGAVVEERAMTFNELQLTLPENERQAAAADDTSADYTPSKDYDDSDEDDDDDDSEDDVEIEEEDGPEAAADSQ